MRIYVASRYTPWGCPPHDAARVAHQNVLAAIEAGIDLLRAGHIPYIPLLSHYMHLESDLSIPYETWCRNNLAWLSLCNGMLVLSESPGVRQEIKWAQRFGLPLWYDIRDVPAVEAPLLTRSQFLRSTRRHLGLSRRDAIGRICWKRMLKGYERKGTEYLFRGYIAMAHEIIEEAADIVNYAALCGMTEEQVDAEVQAFVDLARHHALELLQRAQKVGLLERT